MIDVKIDFRISEILICENFFLFGFFFIWIEVKISGVGNANFEILMTVRLAKR